MGIPKKNSESNALSGWLYEQYEAINHVNWNINNFVMQAVNPYRQQTVSKKEMRFVFFSLE